MPFLKQIKILRHSLLFTFIIVIAGNTCVFAQQSVPGQWLVRLHPDMKPDNLSERLQRQMTITEQSDPLEEWPSKDKSKDALNIQPVSNALNIWLLKQASPEAETLNWLLQQPEVAQAQPNHILSLRSNLLPNDPLFNQQWHYNNDGSGGGTPNADLDADDAWDISTGGVTMAGDTIVIAVIDGGVSKMHQDLVKNLWKNRAETPHDGIDNDGNGYVDDYLGWNVFAQNDNIQGITSMHGTPVCGIVGASGNNGIGVSGVNWNVKIMFVAGGNLESDMLAAYDYVLRARLKYNQSNGSGGAFVVALNCSWGIDYGMPANAPLWCAAFDELGKAGIISVAATANNPVDIDLVGDLPTTCPSDFLLSVTSLNMMDQLAPSAAWGEKNIDLGAYGESIYTTMSGNQYGVQSGTSFAAPQVAGAIGLLYAAPCPELIAQAKTNPESAAAWVKSMILESAVPNTSLQNRSVSDGRLNLNTLLRNYEDQCASCPPPFALKTFNISTDSVLLSWSQTAATQSVQMRWRKAGIGNWLFVNNVASGYVIKGLQPCSNYEYALRSVCAGGQLSDWSPAFEFISKGCCEVPDFSWDVLYTDEGALITWTDLNNIGFYKVLIHETNGAGWEELYCNENNLFLFDLKSCTSYDIQIQAFCLHSWVNMMPLTSFQTPGCGACLDKDYCAAGANEALEEWIAAVQIGNWQYVSGWGGGGYQNLTGQQTSNPQITPASTVNIKLTPGFWGTQYKEYFRIYVDFNLDGDFDDPDELAYDPGFAQEGVVNGVLTSPFFTENGTTRMRVMMKYAEDNQIPPNACGFYNFGQVEDYCVDLVDVSTEAKTSVDSTLSLKIYPQPATNLVWIDVSKGGRAPFDLKIWDVSGRLLLNENRIPLRNGAIYLDTTPWASGVYIVTAEYEGKLFRGKLIKR